MNLDELVPMPEPMVFQPVGFGTDGSYTAAQLRADREAIARAVAERCAEICETVSNGLECAEENAQGMSTGAQSCAEAIRCEFRG